MQAATTEPADPGAFADVLERRGATREAARALQQHLSREPGDLSAARKLAWILGRDGRDEEYLRVFEAHAERWRRDPYLLLVAAQAWARTGRLEAAGRAFERLSRDRAAAAYRAAVREGLRFVAREGGAAAKVRGALRRAMAVGGLGLVLIGGVVFLTLRLRLRRAGRPEVRAVPPRRT